MTITKMMAQKKKDINYKCSLGLSMEGEKDKKKTHLMTFKNEREGGGVIGSQGRDNEEEKGGTICPRIAHGQRYPLRCSIYLERW